MKNIYDAIWSDALQNYRKHHPEVENWLYKVFMLTTFIFSLNFWLVVLWLKYFGIDLLIKVQIDFFPGTILNNFFGYVIEFWLPSMLINYVFIVLGDRYEKIMASYPLTTKKYALKHGFITLFLTVASVIVYPQIA